MEDRRGTAEGPDSTEARDPGLLTISPLRVAQGLAACVFLLTVANALAQFSEYRLGEDLTLFDVDAEANIPTFYSSAALMLCALLLGLIAWLKRLDSDRYFLHWAVLGLIFFGLSVDETTQIHEKLIPPMRKIFTGGGVLHYPWVVPGAAFLAVVGLMYSRFLLQLPRKTAWLFVAAGGIFAAGALGMELAQANQAYQHGRDHVGYEVVAAVEELLEMVGVVVFAYALLSYLAAWKPDFRVRVGDGSQSC
jgi:hypothetical protein